MLYWRLILTWIQRHLSYRARVLIWFFVDTVNFAIFPFIWLAIYGSRTAIAGFNRADIVTYYIIIAFISTVASSHISRIIRTDIMRGELNVHLLRPLSYIIFRSFQDVGYHLIFVPVSVFILIMASLLLPNYIFLPHSPVTVLLFTCSLILSYTISHCLELLVGFCTFWLGETNGPTQVREIADIVFSGQIAPLIFFPPLIQAISVYSPFQYLFYAPTQIYLQKMTLLQIAQNFAGALAWILGLFALIALLWRRGLRQYEGAGI